MKYVAEDKSGEGGHLFEQTSVTNELTNLRTTLGPSLHAVCPSSGQPGAVAWIPALGSVSGSSCFLVLARQACSRALPPWGHKVQRGQTTNSRVERPNYNVTTHPLPSTVPASTLTAVTRHRVQVWPARCNGPPHEISPSPSLQLWPA